MKQQYKIENFIGIFDNYITQQECDKAIRLFERENKFKKTLSRKQFEDASIVEKKDVQYFAGSGNLDIWWEDLKSLMINFNLAFNHYLQETGGDAAYDHGEFHFTQLKVQKTLPKEGYHQWHIEHMRGAKGEPRAFAYSVYLNDVEDGGETEFLHFSKRVKPKMGRIVIWPSGFPYVHRGNPPLSGEKYILTSWMNLRSV
jgi:hypothetical protein|tara:strand:- start:37 stop:636 length:600 start_codon:yes stop_codon:yes gene_type:complete